MNCLTTLLMSLTSIGDKILILGDEWGGHASVKEVCKRLGLKIYLLLMIFLILILIMKLQIN